MTDTSDDQQHHMDIEAELGRELNDDAKRRQSRHKRLKNKLQQRQSQSSADESSDVPSSGGDDDDEEAHHQHEDEDGDHVMLDQLAASINQRRANKTKNQAHPYQHQRPTATTGDEADTLAPQHRINLQDLGETRFFDTECFNLDDQLVRRTVYRASDQLPGRVQRVSAWNFTEKQFEVQGATQWYQLKPEKLNLLISIFSALKFACGKQEKKQAPEKLAAARNNRRKKNNSNDAQANAAAQDEQNAGEQPQDGQAPPSVPQGENLRFIQVCWGGRLFASCRVCDSPVIGQ